MRHPQGSGPRPRESPWSPPPSHMGPEACLLPERPDLTVHVEVRGWGSDGGLEGWTAKVQSPSAANLPGTLSFPGGGGGWGAA